MSNLLVDWQALGQQALDVAKIVGIKLLEIIGIFIAGYIVIKIIMGLLKKFLQNLKCQKSHINFY